ncbi:Carotenoid isomerase (chromatophore) [Paulinella micropora]|uniref:prolycopene isomerase n=1 Tax=Paulinella micropora TaxID=1928728 RepID=A0A1L5YD03_9EUKA|nr:carotenoid isomerase [Paulinella micropora]AQX45335.1 Carotenoid isomerase [Paulinella micropora]BBL86554.1 Carotenoid isomerase [Paulinella micropora]
MTPSINNVTSSLNTELDALIIGSGVGGLVTGTQLASKGAKVLVLERYLTPGGSGSSFRREGYTFDVGASMVFGLGKKGYTNLLTRALNDIGEECSTISDPVQLEYHLPDQFRLEVNYQYKDFIACLSNLFPHESKGISQFYNTCWQIFRALDAIPLLSLEDPNYLAKVFLRNPLACLTLARWLPVNVGDVARQYITDERLLKFIDMECYCWSVMPADLTPIINAGMVFSDRHAGGINYPSGGVGTIAEKLATGLQRYGGAIRYKSRVSEIIIKDEKAIGVRLSNNEEIYARVVISNATRWNTFGTLLNKSYIPKTEKTWSKRYKPSPSFVSLHLGVRAEAIPLNTHCHHLLLESWNEMEAEQGTIFVSIPTLLDPSLAPTGRHIIHAFTPSMITGWENLYSSAYFQAKKTSADRLIHRLESIFPGLNKGITNLEIGTPRSHRRFLGRQQGTYGPIPAMRLPGLLPMPLNTTEVERLYCVGDSCFPGQGLNAVAFSGFACADRVGADLNLN